MLQVKIRIYKMAIDSFQGKNRNFHTEKYKGNRRGIACIFLARQNDQPSAVYSGRRTKSIRKDSVPSMMVRVVKL